MKQNELDSVQAWEFKNVHSLLLLIEKHIGVTFAVNYITICPNCKKIKVVLIVKQKNILTLRNIIS